MIRFTKMQGLGNDYLYVYGKVPDNVQKICRKLSDRHFGVGSDGMIFISPSSKADFRMRIFNADGSEAEMCGNGIRCVGKYLFDKGYTDRLTLHIETLAGIRALYLHSAGGKIGKVTVDMGKAVVGRDTTVLVDDVPLTGTPVSMGNPHFVVFTDDVKAIPLQKLGPAVENDPSFAGGVNAEFAEIIGNSRIRMRVWERGSGVTMACGTGACAAAAAAAAKGLCKYGSPVYVTLDGGTLRILPEEDGEILMTGPAETICEGVAYV